MRLASIASGSSGNCLYVGTENTHILIDDGISRKKVLEGLKTLDLSIEDITAVLVTHEHSDHIDGLGVLLRKNEIPVYASQGTIDGILAYDKIGKVPRELFNPVKADEQFVINDMVINPFCVSHDANEPLAYTFESGEKRAGIITDLGVYTDYTIENLQGMNALLVEANHDVNMLQAGRYPYFLKKRIAGDRGHLSNEASGRLLDSILNDNIKGVMLGHLSSENNYADLAFETVRLEVNLSDSRYKADDFEITVAKRHEATKAIVI